MSITVREMHLDEVAAVIDYVRQSAEIYFDQLKLERLFPLSAGMQIEARTASPDEVVLGAPLGPNINHLETAFGGSMSALAILSAWSLLHVKLTAGGYKTRLVIQRTSMSYDKPVLEYFTAHTKVPEA